MIGVDLEDVELCSIGCWHIICNRCLHSTGPSGMQSRMHRGLPLESYVWADTVQRGNLQIIELLLPDEVKTDA